MLAPDLDRGAAPEFQRNREFSNQTIRNGIAIFETDWGQ